MAVGNSSFSYCPPFVRRRQVCCWRTLLPKINEIRRGARKCRNSFCPFVGILRRRSIESCRRQSIQDRGGDRIPIWRGSDWLHLWRLDSSRLRRWFISIGQSVSCHLQDKACIWIVDGVRVNTYLVTDAPPPPLSFPVPLFFLLPFVPVDNAFWESLLACRLLLELLLFC